MSNLSVLHALIDRAEQAAVHCDGPALEEAVLAMHAASDSLSNLNLSAEELDELRAHLVRYREVCALMGQTLEKALRQASESDSRYAEQGSPVHGDARALVQRYG